MMTMEKGGAQASGSSLNPFPLDPSADRCGFLPERRVTNSLGGRGTWRSLNAMILPAPIFAGGNGAMQPQDQNLRLAITFLYDAQHDLDGMLATPEEARDEKWHLLRRMAMSYWARAYAWYRQAHAASQRVALRDVAA